MLATGFLDEVRALRARGDLHPDLPSMRCVGYRQAWSHLEGELDAEEIPNGDGSLAAWTVDPGFGVLEHVAPHRPQVGSDRAHPSDVPAGHRVLHRCRMGPARRRQVVR